MTKTVTVELDTETAKQVLSQFEKQISDKIRERDELAGQVTKLEESIKTLRSQLQGSGNGANRAAKGDNKQRVKDYLAQLTDNKGARMSDISKATGISPSSTNFTLSNYTKDFVRDDATKLWKLKN